MKLIATLLLSSALLAGCSTSSVPVTKAKMVPPSRLMVYQNTPSVPYATLTVVRDSGLLASVCRIGLYIDGEFAASLESSEKAEFRLPAGSRTLSLGQDMIENGRCAWRQEQSQQPMQLRAGETRAFRISGDPGQGFVLLPSVG